jgi:hypothetical protein
MGLKKFITKMGKIHYNFNQCGGGGAPRKRIFSVTVALRFGRKQ